MMCSTHASLHWHQDPLGQPHRVAGDRRSGGTGKHSADAERRAWMVEIKAAREADAIGAAGRVVADILAAARAVAAPGVTLKELDATAREVLARAGATSPFLNYHPQFAPVEYPAVICTSVNDAALHGIPGDYRLRDGDLLSVDAGATLDGWVGDAAISFSVGTPASGDAELIAATEEALAAGIAAARPGGRLGDISAAIGQGGGAGGGGHLPRARRPRVA